MCETVDSEQFSITKTELGIAPTFASVARHFKKKRPEELNHQREYPHSNSEGPTYSWPGAPEQSQEYSLAGTYPYVAPNPAQVKVQIDSLKSRGFSTGLARELTSNAVAFSNRIWVVDNSGSMEIPDGHRVVMTEEGKLKQQRVSRWEELQETVTYHAEMAGILQTPTIFRLLNDPQCGPQEMSVASPQNKVQEIANVRSVMQQAKPTGVTPLTTHILQINRVLHRMAPSLRREGKRVAVILATDGLPTDDEGFGGDDITEEFVRALKSMEGLPIWLVIRLCTDEEKVTKFYNALDGQFELSLEVLDDFLGEAREVYKHNKWLNYSMPLHRCRELGYHDRLFDLIDERPLTRGELRAFCALLFGVDGNEIPDPNVEWRSFVAYLQTALAREPNQYDPIRKKVKPMINIRVLNRVYGQDLTCIPGCAIL